MTLREKIALRLIIDMIKQYKNYEDMQILFSCFHAYGLSIKEIRDLVFFSINKSEYPIIKDIIEKYNDNEKQFLTKINKRNLN